MAAVPSGFMARNNFFYRYEEANCFRLKSKEHRERAETLEGREGITENPQFTKGEATNQFSISNCYARISVLFFFFSLEALANWILLHLSDLGYEDKVHEIIWSRSITDKFKRLHRVCPGMSAPIPMGQKPYQCLSELEEIRHSFGHSRIVPTQFRIVNVETQALGDELDHTVRLKGDLSRFNFSGLFKDIYSLNYESANDAKSIVDEIVEDLDRRFNRELTKSQEGRDSQSWLRSPARIYKPDSDRLAFIRSVFEKGPP
ncbi:MAG: hypothetical protein ACE5IM_08480 [Nitrospinota bacterium]